MLHALEGASLNGSDQSKLDSNSIISLAAIGTAKSAGTNYRSSISGFFLIDQLIRVTIARKRTCVARMAVAPKRSQSYALGARDLAMVDAELAARGTKPRREIARNSPDSIHKPGSSRRP